MKYLCYVFAIMLVLSSCGYKYEYVMNVNVVNHSMDTVYFYYSSVKSPNTSQMYFNASKPLCPDSISTIELLKSDFENGQKMWVAFVKAQTLRELTWPVMQERDSVDRILFYSYEDLQASHFIVECK